MEKNEILQQYSDTCAIKSQQLILKDFNIDFTEDELVKFSVDNGWYNGNGTRMEDVGRLLDAAHIPCRSKMDSNVFDLINELQQGHKIIVGVDSTELYESPSWFEKIKDFFMGGNPDHALIVAGIDVSDPQNPQVIVTDPGTGDEKKAYPLEHFMEAWADSKCFMCSTNVAPAEIAEQFTHNAEVTQNDTWQNMQMPEIANVDNQTFHQFLDYSHCIPPTNFSIQMPMLYNSFSVLPMNPGWGINDALCSFNMPLYEPMMSMPLPPPIMPCDFNYNAVMDTSWIFQPYTPTYFPPVAPMSFNPQFAPIPTNNFSNNESNRLDPNEDCIDNGDHEGSDDSAEFHSEIANELSEVYNSSQHLATNTQARGFSDIDISTTDSSEDEQLD